MRIVHSIVQTLIVGFVSRMTCFDSWLNYVGYVVGKLTLKRVSLQAL
jgi:hypothetical protein